MADDKQLIFEAYTKMLEEGFMDRLKANTTSAVQNVKSAGSNVVNTVKGAIAGATGNIDKAQEAKENRRQNSLQGQRAKIATYQDSVYNKIDDFVDDIENDMFELKIRFPNSDFDKLKYTLRVFFMKQFNELLDTLK